MYLQFPGDVASVRDNGVCGKEQAVGYFAVCHPFDDADHDFLFACAECLLFFVFGLRFRRRMEALQFVANLVRAVVDADLVVVGP